MRHNLTEQREIANDPHSQMRKSKSAHEKIRIVLMKNLKSRHEDFRKVVMKNLKFAKPLIWFLIGNKIKFQMLAPKLVGKR
jgi:hypothetical protein